MRLKAGRVEQLIVVKENRMLVEKFLATTTYTIQKNDNAFERIEQEREGAEKNAGAKASDVFNTTDIPEPFPVNHELQSEMIYFESDSDSDAESDVLNS